MRSTDALIGLLVARLTPVRRLGAPLPRALGWIALATALVGFLVLLRGPRLDLALRFHDPAYLVQLGGAWLTGTAAALAAFEVSLPDRSRAWLLLPAPSLALWLYGFAYGCLAHWIAIPAGAPIVIDSLHCLETIAMASLPLALGLWLTLRRTRTLRPVGTAALASLAVAGFADSAHLLIHVIDASLLVLVVNLVPAALIVALGSVLGRAPVDLRL